MTIETAIAWFLVGLSSGIAMVGFAVIAAVLAVRVSEHRQDVLRKAMKGGKE